jgi:hypothetical protein
VRAHGRGQSRAEHAPCTFGPRSFSLCTHCAADHHPRGVQRHAADRVQGKLVHVYRRVYGVECFQRFVQTSKRLSLVIDQTMYIHKNTHANACAFFITVCVCVYEHVHMHACVHIYTHTNKCTHDTTHTHTHTHTYPHACVSVRRPIDSRIRSGWVHTPTPPRSRPPSRPCALLSSSHSLGYERECV